MSKIREFWWNFLDTWDQFPAMRWTVIGALALGLVLVAGFARAVEPGWYAPDDNGEGLIVRCNNSDECAMVWLTHSDGGQLWLISTENCPRDSAVCDVPLADTTGTWRGIAGETEIAEPTVTLSVTQNEVGVMLAWNARALFPDQCFDIGSGGLILRQCDGKKQFDLLAR